MLGLCLDWEKSAGVLLTVRVAGREMHRGRREDLWWHLCSCHRCLINAAPRRSQL